MKQKFGGRVRPLTYFSALKTRARGYLLHVETLQTRLRGWRTESLRRGTSRSQETKQMPPQKTGYRDMRVGILHSQSYYRLPEGSVWSGRIRASWIWENWPEAEAYRDDAAYDAVIFTPHCARPCARAKGNPVRILDVCNPDWMRPRFIQQSLRLCAAVTCSSPQITAHMQTMTARPVEYFPDRLDLSKYPLQKTHAGPARSAAWFGYASSQETLADLVPHVLSRGLRLTVVSDQLRRELFGRHADAIHFEPYRHETFEDTLLKVGDIALNPRLERGRFQYKSNNRSLTAWALGIPVAANEADLDLFADEGARKSEAALRLDELRNRWDIRTTVEAYRNLILKLKEERR